MKAHRRRSGLCLAIVFACLFAGNAERTPAADAERFGGTITIPIDLFTSNGTRIEKRKYEIEVAPGDAQWSLSLVSEGKARVEVKGSPATGDRFDLPATIPLVGTHYLRSSLEPLKTAQERQFSKTGLPQYAEQERNWRATVRVYRGSINTSDVFFVVQIRSEQGLGARVDFKLRSEDKR